MEHNYAPILDIDLNSYKQKSALCPKFIPCKSLAISVQEFDFRVLSNAIHSGELFPIID